MNVLGEIHTSAYQHCSISPNEIIYNRHYSVLHQNIVSMGTALDNYPSSATDPREAINRFPDDIMRKDVLDELQPPGHTILPKAPPIPACHKCAASNVCYISLCYSMSFTSICIAGICIHMSK